jgi:hypothetical protein
MTGQVAQPTGREIEDPDIRLTAPAGYECQGRPIRRERSLIIKSGIIGQALET